MSRENPLETECFGKWRCVQTRQIIGKVSSREEPPLESPGMKSERERKRKEKLQLQKRRLRRRTPRRR